MVCIDVLSRSYSLRLSSEVKYTRLVRVCVFDLTICALFAQAAEEKENLTNSVATSAQGIFSSLVDCLADPDTDTITKQAALLVVQSCALAFGRSHSNQLVDLIDRVGLLVQEECLEVKGSVLATIAAMIKGLKQEAVPHLPKVMLALKSLAHLVGAQSLCSASQL